MTSDLSSALEVLNDDALYKSTYTLLYFYFKRRRLPPHSVPKRTGRWMGRMRQDVSVATCRSFKEAVAAAVSRWQRSIRRLDKPQLSLYLPHPQGRRPASYLLHPTRSYDHIHTVVNHRRRLHSCRTDTDDATNQTSCIANGATK